MYKYRLNFKLYKTMHYTHKTHLEIKEILHHAVILIVVSLMGWCYCRGRDKEIAPLFTILQVGFGGILI